MKKLLRKFVLIRKKHVHDRKKKKKTRIKRKNEEEIKVSKTLSSLK